MRYELLLVLCIACTPTKEVKALRHMCGLVTGVPEYKFADNVFYCRTKSGDLIKPNNPSFRFETIIKDGVKTINYVPVKGCK